MYLNKISKVACTAFLERVITVLNKVKGFSSSALGSLQIDNLSVDDAVTGSPRNNKTSIEFKSGILTENILVAMDVLTG